MCQPYHGTEAGLPLVTDDLHVVQFYGHLSVCLPLDFQQHLVLLATLFPWLHDWPSPTTCGRHCCCYSTAINNPFFLVQLPVHRLPSKTISQILLQLGMAMWLSAGQQDLRKNLLRSFWDSFFLFDRRKEAHQETFLWLPWLILFLIGFDGIYFWNLFLDVVV